MIQLFVYLLPNLGEENLLNNQYYKDMINPNIPWTNEFIRRKSKWQFGNAIRTGTRLNTDLELVYDLSINSDGSCSCTVGTNCDIADSYTLVETYAEVHILIIVFSSNFLHSKLGSP